MPIRSFEPTFPCPPGSAGVRTKRRRISGWHGGEAAAQVFWRETVNKNSGVPTLQVDGRRVTEIWNNGVAEYRWQLTQYQPHFWNEGQAENIWSEMFSKYSRTASGQLVRLP